MFLTGRSLRNVARIWVDNVRALVGQIPVLFWPEVQHIVDQCREAGALTPQTAQPYHARSRAEEDAFQQLLRLDVIRQPRPGRYYLDERVLGTLPRPIHTP